MSIVSDALQFGFTGLLDATGETITFNGVTHDCIASRVNQEWVLTVGGEERNVEVQFECSEMAMITVDTTLVTVDDTLHTVDEGTTHPVVGMKVRYHSPDYRVLQTRLNKLSGTYLILCGSIDK